MGASMSAPRPYQGCTILAPSSLQDFAFFAANRQVDFTINLQNSIFLCLP
jgi:hypothetical protein